MPKSQVIDPKEQRAAGQIEFSPIPVNQYRRTVKDELANFSKEDLFRIWRDMAILRGFESMLNEVKLTGKYHEIEYNYRGPAHLSMGQESASVGQAYLLDVDDHIYGSHRSHGEILAKGLSAIQKLGDDDLQKIMREFLGGETLKVVEKGFNGSVKDLAVDYLLYGALAEIFARKAGFNLGMGGSMHAFFTPFGIYPNNAIVGGSGDISVGAALFKKCNQKPGIVIGNIGDASIGCGPVWEGLMLANMDQFKTLWEAPYRGGLPYVLNFVNNFYGMGGQPQGETMGFKMLARLGAGISPTQMHAERVDGFNPLAVIDAMKRKRAIIEAGDGPILLDTLTYRFGGHSPSDASSYRDKAEVELWQAQDPIHVYAKDLIEAGVCKQKDIDAAQEHVNGLLLATYKKSIDLEISPRFDLMIPVGNQLETTMFSNLTVESLDPSRKAQVKLARKDNPRVQGLAKRSRHGLDDAGKPLPKGRCIGIRDALFEAVLDAFETDPTLVAYGEENRDWGGAFAVYRGLTEALPYNRLFNSPISEAAIVGSAVGYALEGGRALVELMYCDFLGRAGDEVFNQLAKWQSMSGGVLKMPVVLRVSVGSKYGAQHSQDWTSICAHIPGLKVCFPATPYDAKGLLRSALTGTDPVIFFESQRLYDQAELFHAGGVPLESYAIPFGEPDVKRAGKDITLLTIGATLYRAIKVADALQKDYGVSAEIIDARSIAPFNYDKVIESVKKTRKIVLISDACERASVLHSMASTISQVAFDELDAPPVVVGARNWITPPDEMEEAFFPFPDAILDAIDANVLPLKGYKPVRPADGAELLRRAKLGI